jgi:hypothetical protein
MEVKAWEDLTPEEQEERWEEARKAQDRISRARSVKKLRRTAGRAIGSPEGSRSDLLEAMVSQDPLLNLSDEADLRRIAREAGRAERLARALIARKALERMGEL